MPNYAFDGTARGSSHDRLQAIVCKYPQIFTRDSQPPRDIKIEYMLDPDVINDVPNYIDVLIESANGLEAWIVEAKTEAEHACAGSMVRQLERYEYRLRRQRAYHKTHLVGFCEDCHCGVDDVYPTILRQAGVYYVCLNCCFAEVPGGWALHDGTWPPRAEPCSLWLKKVSKSA